MTIGTNERAFQDAFNLLCDDFVARGTYRDVYTCRLNPDWVVKVEIDKGDWRSFSNVFEHKFWEENRFYAKVADWLAPCHFLSPDGRILIQSKARIAKESDNLPEAIPAFFTDLKPSNFGWIGDKFVCVDYAFQLSSLNVKPKRVPHWVE